MERTPMSHAGMIIGIPGPEIEWVKRSRGYRGMDLTGGKSTQTLWPLLKLP
jgi:hypothetical protein